MAEVLFRATIQEGLRQLRLTGSGAAIEVRSIDVIPLYPDGEIPFEGISATSIYPSAWVWMPWEGDTRVLCLKRKTHAGYEFGLSDPGDYRLSIEARNDLPGPVLLEVRLDDAALGILMFDRQDNSWEEKGFSLHIDAGEHLLDVRFLNEMNVGETDPDLDNDAWIRRLRLSPASGANPVDQRTIIPTHPPRAIALVEAGTSQPNPGWSLEMEPDVQYNIETDADGEAMFTAILQRQNGAQFLLAPPLPIDTGGVLYYSALLRAENLDNHSINMCTYFLDNKGELVDTHIVNQEGITGTTDWVRFVELYPMPAGTSYYCSCFWVYENGKKTSDEAGTVYFKDLRIEAVD